MIARERASSQASSEQWLSDAEQLPITILASSLKSLARLPRTAIASWHLNGLPSPETGEISRFQRPEGF